MLVLSSVHSVLLLLFVALFGEYVYIDSMDQEQELLCRIAYEILIATERVVSEELSDDELLTAPELAKRFGIKLDKLKRKLKALRREDLITPISMSPKRYRFDFYTFRNMSPEHPLYEGLNTVQLSLEALREGS